MPSPFSSGPTSPTPTTRSWRGAIRLLSTSEPAGVTVPHGTYELYRTPAGNELAGIRLFWPPDLPRGGPRPESVLVVVTDRPRDLRALEQREITRSPVRYRVHRFDFLLHPRARPRTEPPFRVGLRPDLSVRLSPPRRAGPRPAGWRCGSPGGRRAAGCSR